MDALAALVVFIPQFLYWKHVTGQFIFFSYKNTEGFDFMKPHILNVLFSFKKSLFVYTPVLIFVVAGFFWVEEVFSSLSPEYNSLCIGQFLFPVKLGRLVERRKFWNAIFCSVLCRHVHTLGMCC